jgi:hypothetical protein
MLLTQIDMTSRSPDRKDDDWLFYTIPMADLDCPAPEGMNQLLWEVKDASSNVGMCLDNVRINRGGGGGGDSKSL